ncbi:hypothetical protein [Ancylobacter sp.]|uniref:hypothetical protein n=1 Tax=Ancylobacter sp. TaxID=1872567 RepID=UPI003BA8FB3D
MAVVWHGGGRRWFTRRAAENAEARRLINKRCECDNGDAFTPPYTCGLHKDAVKNARRTRLMVAMFVRPTTRAALPQEEQE